MAQDAGACHRLSVLLGRRDRDGSDALRSLRGERRKNQRKEK
jgi:hypothetical protein